MKFSEWLVNLTENEEDRPVILSNQKYAGTIIITIKIGVKIYQYDLDDSEQAYKLISQLSVPGAEWVALNTIKAIAKNTIRLPDIHGRWWG